MMSKSRLKAFSRNEDGSTAVEYALIALVVSVSIVPLLSDIAPKLAAIFASIVALMN